MLTLTDLDDPAKPQWSYTADTADDDETRSRWLHAALDNGLHSFRRRWQHLPEPEPEDPESEDRASDHVAHEEGDARTRW